MLIIAAFFGSGMGLIFYGLNLKSWKNRFYKDRQVMRKNDLIARLKLVFYPNFTQWVSVKSKSLSRAAIEEMLNKAGYPMGIKARDFLALKMLLPLAAMAAVFLLYSVQATCFLLEKLTSAGSTKLQAPEGWSLFFSLILAGLGFFWLPTIVVQGIIAKREKKVLRELGLFSEVVFMSIRARLSLGEALEEAGKTTEYLRPYLDICLNEWFTDKMKALHNLKRAVPVPTFQLIIDLLIQTAQIGDENIADFLEENKKLEDELKLMEISARNKIIPLFLTLQMFMPILIILFVLFYPLSIQVQSLLKLF